MSIPLTVTSGATILDTTTVDETVLNLIANPQVEIPPGAGIDSTHLNLVELLAAIGDQLRGFNHVRNGDLADWATPDGIEVINGQSASNAYDFQVRAQGGSVHYRRGITAPPNPNDVTRYAIELEGITDGGVLVGQYLEPTQVAKFQPGSGGQAMFSVWVNNSTGATITPQITYGISNVEGDRDDVTLVDQGAVTQTIGNNAWNRISHQVSTWPSGSERGMWIFVKVPSGVLSSAAKFVRLAQWQIESGTLLTTWSKGPYHSEAALLAALDTRLSESVGDVDFRLSTIEDSQAEVQRFVSPGQHSVTIPSWATFMRVYAGGAGGAHINSNAYGGPGGTTVAKYDLTQSGTPDAGDILRVLVGAKGLPESLANHLLSAVGFGGTVYSINPGGGAAGEGGGGGLSGVWAGTGTIGVGDAASALQVAGGGGAAANRNDTQLDQGGPGNGTGGGANMQGIAAFEDAVSTIGGGGGGYTGGLARGGGGARQGGMGGRGFILSATGVTNSGANDAGGAYGIQSGLDTNTDRDAPESSQPWFEAGRAGTNEDGFVRFEFFAVDPDTP